MTMGDSVVLWRSAQAGISAFRAWTGALLKGRGMSLSTWGCQCRSHYLETGVSWVVK